jgi:glycerol kinase
MKSFRQHIKEKAYPISYEKNKQLMALVKKYDDPLKFILKVMTMMNLGKLKLSRIGVANTREVAALWNDHNTKQISPALIENLSEMELLDEDFKSMVKNVKNIFKDTRKKIDIRGWKIKIHKGKHPDVKDVAKDGNILFAIDPDTGEEHHIASGNLSDVDIKKFMKMYGLRK